MLEKFSLLKMARLQGACLEQGFFGVLARRVVGADQQVADDPALRIAQCRDRDDRREAAAVLADVGQLVDVLDAARGLEHQRLEARRDRRLQLGAQCLGPRDHFLRIGDVGRRDPVHHLGGRIAQHPLGADVEDLDHALGVGGDAREIRAIEDGALQGSRLEQGFLTTRLDAGLRRGPDRIQEGGSAKLVGHCGTSVKWPVTLQRRRRPAA